MAAALPLKQPIKVSHLMRRRLRELKRSPGELAEAIQVPEEYVVELLEGRRPPPAPGRTDIYDRMTRFLRLHRNDLPTCAKVERDVARPGRRRLSAQIRDRLLSLCDPTRLRNMERRMAGKGGVDLEHVVCQRLIEVAQGFVVRQLDDTVELRIAATRNGGNYLELRMKLFDFLEVVPATLTAKDFDEYVRPRVSKWDIDYETHTMRIVLRNSDPGPRQRRPFGI
jgi:hypothetical protein